MKKLAPRPLGRPAVFHGPSGPRLLLALALAMVPPVLGPGRAAGQMVDLELTPTPPVPGSGNRADLTLLNTTFGNPDDFDTDTTYAQVGSVLEVHYDLPTTTLTLLDASVTGSSIDFFDALDIDVTNILIELDTSQTLPFADVSGGTVAWTDVPILFSALVEGSPFIDQPITLPLLSGDFSYDDVTGDMVLTNLVGDLDPLDFPFSIFTFRLTGTVYFDLEGNGLPPDAEVFADGFESGDVSAWSSVTP